MNNSHLSANHVMNTVISPKIVLRQSRRIQKTRHMSNGNREKERK
jgi:hypothetical protein